MSESFIAPKRQQMVRERQAKISSSEQVRRTNVRREISAACYGSMVLLSADAWPLKVLLGGVRAAAPSIFSYWPTSVSAPHDPCVSTS